MSLGYDLFPQAPLPPLLFRVWNLDGSSVWKYHTQIFFNQTTSCSLHMPWLLGYEVVTNKGWWESWYFAENDHSRWSLWHNAKEAHAALWLTQRRLCEQMNEWMERCRLLLVTARGMEADVKQLTPLSACPRTTPLCVLDQEQLLHTEGLHPSGRTRWFSRACADADGFDSTEFWIHIHCTLF